VGGVLDCHNIHQTYLYQCQHSSPYPDHANSNNVVQAIMPHLEQGSCHYCQ